MTDGPITSLCLNVALKGQIKTIPVFRVITRPYLNLLVKPIIFSGFLGGKMYNFMHFERRNAFQNA